MIKTFADKVSAALFLGKRVKRLPPVSGVPKPLLQRRDKHVDFFFLSLLQEFLFNPSSSVLPSSSARV